ITKGGKRIMKTAIIFDMDGTLFQTNLILEPALEATFDVLREEKLWEGAAPIDKYREIMGATLPEVWRTLCPNHPEETRERSNALFHEHLIQLIKGDKGALYEQVEQTLEQLSSKYPLYIASNGQVEYLKAIVEVYRLERFIENTYSIELIDSRNKSELVQLVKAENDITGGFVVGDRASDIRAAKDNGLTSIGVRFDFSQESELKQADYVVESFAELLAIV
ncbi:MAG: HAD-IA family hydrolase, partial [Lysinibacillus sp.]